MVAEAAMHACLRLNIVIISQIWSGWGRIGYPGGCRRYFRRARRETCSARLRFGDGFWIVALVSMRTEGYVRGWIWRELNHIWLSAADDRGFDGRVFVRNYEIEEQSRKAARDG